MKSRLYLFVIIMLVTATFLSCISQIPAEGPDPGSQGIPNLKPYNFYKLGHRDSSTGIQKFKWRTTNVGSETAVAPWTDAILIDDIPTETLEIEEDLAVDCESDFYVLEVVVPTGNYEACLWIDYDDDVPEGLYEGDNDVSIEENTVMLPGYDDYSPQGLPDFDQRQDDTWKSCSGWSHCGPTCAANILWYFDSKYEDGEVGDGVSDYPLVGMRYKIDGDWIYTDDDHIREVPPLLIESLADYYCFTNTILGGVPCGEHLFCFVGTRPGALKAGIKNWMSRHGIDPNLDYSVTWPAFPSSWSVVKDAIDNGIGVILGLSSTNNPFNAFHYVTVQGYIDDNPEERDKIILSDPVRNPTLGDLYAPIEYNDANIVSYDTCTWFDDGDGNPLYYYINDVLFPFCKFNFENYRGTTESAEAWVVFTIFIEDLS